MAQRRMISLKIVDTDAFMDMALSTQALYMHLLMRADDDGFVSNPKKIARMVGSTDDELKMLTAKRFIIPFESGVCVIKHWLIHNLVRVDRYSETQYLAEKSSLVVDSHTKKYSLKQGDNYVIPNGNQVQPQVRLGKVRLGNNHMGITEQSDDYKFLSEEWNKYKTFSSLGISKQPINETVKKKLLPECRKMTVDISNAWKAQERKGATVDDFREAVRAYINEIINRKGKNGYDKHRFTLYEFVKQANGFTKFNNK